MDNSNSILLSQQEEAARKGSKKKIGVVALVSVLACGAAAYATWGHFFEKTQSASDKARSEVVAVVNGESIYEGEVAIAMQQGMQRAVAIDSYINKVLAVQKMGKDIPEDVKVAAVYAQRDVYARAWSQTMLEKAKKEVTEQEARAWFEENVAAMDQSRYMVKYSAFGSAEEAQAFIEKLSKGDKDATGQLQSFSSNQKAVEPEPMPAQAFPYNTGKLIRSLKPGQVYAQPIPTREGFLVVKLVDSKQGKKPVFEEAKDQVMAVLVEKKVSEILEKARKSAEIKLK